MKSGYPLLPVGTIIILFYLFSRLFSKWKIISGKLHRKIWNVLLLVTFLITGLLGIVSVIKVNYKLNIPYYDQILKWHVMVGIAMVIVSIFHLSWHWKYYFKRQDKKRDISFFRGDNTEDPLLYRKMPVLLFLLGMLSVINQVIFIREFIGILAGNELVVGLVLSCWMFLTGLGAYAGRKHDFSGFGTRQGVKMIAFIALLPMVLIVMLYWLRFLIFPLGSLIGIVASVFLIMLILFPLCFLSGFLFMAISASFSMSVDKNLIAKAYAFEAAGSIAGGLIFSFVLGTFFNSFQVLGLTTGFTCLCGVWATDRRNLIKKIFFGSAGILVPAIVFYFNPGRLIKKMLYPNQEIILDQSTRYGNLVVTKQAGQLNFYENNGLQFYTENLSLAEEAVHFAMIQREHPRQVLLISGGLSGMIREIRKYPVEKITYLEVNPAIFNHWKSLAGYDEDTDIVDFVKEDIRTFLRKTETIYDVILINLPPPSTLGINRFYTAGFFRCLKKHCDNESVVCTSLPSTANYAGGNALAENASLWKTLGQEFPNRLLLTGEKNYFLGSDSKLSGHISEMIEKKGIETSYVNEYYLDDSLLAQRSGDLEERFPQEVKVNRDFYPVMFLQEVNDWLSHFGTSYYLLILVPLVLFLAGFFIQNAVSAGLYTGGFTSASLEVALLLAYQVFFGSIYLSTALFFAVFMAGLAAGSFCGNHILKDIYSGYARVQFLLALYAVLVPVFILFVDRFIARDFIVRLLFYIFVFIPAFITGYEFYLASRMQALTYGEISGRNYSTDLFGSTFGSFLVSLFLLPVLGVWYACVLIALLNIFSGSWMLFARRRLQKAA